MKRTSYSQFSAPTLNPGEMLVVPTVMHGWLIAWAATEPGVSSFSPGGPAWKYNAEGKERVAKVHLTVALDDGNTAYWNARGDEAEEEPIWVGVVREHSRLLGCQHRVLARADIKANLVEHKNRDWAYHLLASAAEARFDSSELEALLLLAVGRAPATVRDLTISLASTPGRVRVAALRLWKRRLVSLPIRTELLSDTWLIQRVSHV